MICFSSFTDAILFLFGTQDSTQVKLLSVHVPDEVFAHIFICIKDAKSFHTLSLVSQKMYRVAHSIAIYNLHPRIHKAILPQHLAFNRSAVQLMRTVNQRAFTPEEAVRIGSWAMVHVQLQDQQEQKKLMDLCEKAEEQCYQTLKGCCFETEVNNKEMPTYLQVAFKYLRKKSKCNEELELKIDASIEGLHNRLYNDMIKEYVHQPITIDTFNHKIKEIHCYFREKKDIDIECDLRRAIEMEHSTAFEKLADNYLYLTATTPLFFQTKEMLIEEKIESINKEITSLDGYRGKIHRAYLKIKDFERTLVQLDENRIISNFSYNCLNFIPITFSDPYEQVSIAKSRLHDAVVLHSNLYDRLGYCNYLLNHYFSRGQFPEKEQLEIEGKAKLKVRQMGRFYAELRQKVTVDNKEERSLALHEIMKSLL